MDREAPVIGPRRWWRSALARGAMLIVCAAWACGSDRSVPQPTPTPTPENPAPPAAPVRVLLLTATAGFRHDSIASARAALASMASAGELTLTATEDVSAISAATLAQNDVLMFGLTTGELPLDSGQRSAILSFVEGGGGFVGVHSATDTLYGWPEYGTLVGAYFKEHPWTQRARVVVEDRSHPATAGLGAAFEIEEEFYAFRENPRPRVQVLLSLDATSVGATGDYPLAWTRTSGRGRVYYNALGHFPATWSDPRFLAQIKAALRWAADAR